MTMTNARELREVYREPNERAELKVLNHLVSTADRFVGNISTPFSEQIFDISVAEGKPEIQPDSVLKALMLL